VTRHSIAPMASAVAAFFLLACIGPTAVCGEPDPQPEGEGTFERFWPAASMPHTHVTLSSKLDERLGEVLVEEGQQVKKGEVLVKFDLEQVNAKIAMAQVEADFKGRIESATKRYEYLAREYERSKNLDQMISESDLDSDHTQMELSKLELEELKRGQRMADTRLRLYKAEAEDYIVRSPVDGVVADVWIEEGEMAQVGQALVEVIDPSAIEVRVHLREEHTMNVTPGQEAAIRFVTVSQRPVPGTVYFVSPYVDSSSGTFTVKILTEPKTEHIKPGMACEVRFLPPKKP